MKNFCKIGLYITLMFICGCQSRNSNNLVDNKDSTKSIIIKKHKFDFTDRENERLYKIWFNDTILFDSLLLRKIKEYSALEIEDHNDFLFVRHRLDGAYYNFMGIIDKQKENWIIYKKDTSEIPKYITVMMNVAFEGLSPDKKYFLFSGGSSSTSGYEIYNLKGENIYSFASFDLGKGKKVGWNKENKIEYLYYAKVDYHTMPKLDNFYSWVQKYIWSEEGVTRVDSIYQRYTECPAPNTW